MSATSSYNKNSKIFYRPIEAALRWCNLMAYETQILKAAPSWPATLKTIFPIWPCLHANTEKIYDAIHNGELMCGCLGISVPLGTRVDPLQLTIRHNDLKLWMLLYHPDQRPSFLFENSPNDKVPISTDSYLTLQADRDALQLKLRKSEQIYQSLLEDLQAIGLEKEEISQLLNTKKPVSDRSETVYLNIIGALLNLFLDQSPAGNPLSVFKSQSAIVDAVIARYREVPGLSKRTLDEKFAAANRSLKKRK
ncbi:hypothetical protein PS673_01719 [Pseudomonas fluorescens]|uniref:Uncharacterized protein n=1 Tax=Pseudomonas fluorescens TaxID=294 RepID=A0A5E6RLR7_PSEFL|nr:hypothetical protein [Pseudomonas fluorescens]VVM69844.1 hypothetical protein PS673_01719 [Pseudomonas fluorescens]